MIEGKSLQNRLPKLSPYMNGEKNLVRTFSNLMFKGKTSAALQLLSPNGKSDVLYVNDPIDSCNTYSQTVLDVLKSKHLHAQQATPDAVSWSCLKPPQVHPSHPIIYDRIDADCIRSAALHTNGVARPSDIDAQCWRQLCTSFKTASHDLCHALVPLAKRLCMSFVGPMGLSALLAWQLNALVKCPSVRPIGICEMARRIISKAVLVAIKVASKRLSDLCDYVLGRLLELKQPYTQ